MRRLLVLALVLIMPGLPSAADIVLPRLGPLPLVAEDGGDGGEEQVAFGQPLFVMGQDGDVLLVETEAGTALRVQAADVIAAPLQGLTLRAAAEDAAAAAGRPNLLLWDSALRGRSYLGGAIADDLAAPFALPAGQVVPDLALPVLSVEAAPSSVGVSVTMVGALFPLLPEMLEPANLGGRGIVLHVVVDGSDYAREFTLEALQKLSRGLAAGQGGMEGLAQVTRQVIFETGALRDDGEMTVSGLRAEWALPEGGENPGGLSHALVAALDGVADKIAPDDEMTHVVLVLVGPGLSAEGGIMADAEAVGRHVAALRDGGGDVRGVVLLQGTPEPNPANDILLATLSGGAETRSLGFGADPLDGLGALLAAPSNRAAVVDAATACQGAEAAGLPCLLPQGKALPQGTAAALARDRGADWVAMPLWLVAETAPFILLPDGVEPGVAEAAQNAIRRCHSVGQIWAGEDNTCAPHVVGNNSALAAQVTNLMAELSERNAERDTLQQDLLTAEAEQDSLQESLETSLAEVATSRDTIVELQDQMAELVASTQEQAERIKTQEAELTQLGTSLAEGQTLRAELEHEVDARKAELETMQASALAEQDAARDRLAAAASELEALVENLADLSADRDKVAASLVAAEADLASLTAERDDIARQLADMAVATDALRQANAELGAARDAAQTAALAATHERDGLAARLAQAEAAGVLRDEALESAKARIADMEGLANKLSVVGDDAGQQVTILNQQLEEERRTHAETRATDKVELDAALAKLVGLTQERDDLAAQLSVAGTTAADTAAKLQADRDALSVQLAQTRAEAEQVQAGLRDRLSTLEADLMALREATPSTADIPAEQMSDSSVAVSVRRPKPRPDPQAQSAVASAPAAKAPAKAAKKAPAKAAKADGLAELAASNEPAPGTVPSRRVAPAQQSANLKGCQFQWLGQSGKLVCP